MVGSRRITYIWRGCDHTVGIQKERQAHALKDTLEEVDDLQRQHVLAHVISNFEDACLPVVLSLHAVTSAACACQPVFSFSPTLTQQS